jgi:hypothetical protein
MAARFYQYLPVFLALAPAACSRLHGNEESEVPPPYELSSAEIRLARDLAERDLHIPEHPLSSFDRIVFTKIDLLPDSRAGTGQRQVMVQHYRYRDDAVILTAVDLNNREVLSVETALHFPTAFAPEELARAEQMARRDERLQPVFDMPGRTLLVQGRPIQAANADEPLFGHRVVHLLLRHGADYLSTPRVLVDLTTETVLIED